MSEQDPIPPDLDPKVDVRCCNQRCMVYDKTQNVSAGVMVGPGVLMYGTFACVMCGMTMEHVP
jgi:hypothetical protein